MSGFFGGTEKTVDTTKTYEANPLTQQYAAQAQSGVANADPFSQMTARNVAPMTADQLASYQATRNAQGQASPYFTAAQNYLQQGSTPIDMGRVGDLYKNIYDPLARSQSDIFKQQMSQTTGNAVQAAGGTGADRIGVAQAQLAKQQGLAAGELGSRTMQQALDQYNQEKMRQQSAAVLSGNLGMGAQGANLQAIGALNQMGGQQMQFEQLLRDAPWLFQNQAAMFPLQKAMMQGQLTGQLAPGLGGTTTGTETTQLPEQGWGAPLIGGLTTLAGAAMGNPGAVMGGLSSFGNLFGSTPSTPMVGSRVWQPAPYAASGGRIGMESGGGVGGAVPDKRPAFDALMNFARGGEVEKAEGGGFDDFNARFGAASGDNYDIPNPMLAAAANYVKDQQRFDPTPNTAPMRPDDGGTFDMPRPPELGDRTEYNYGDETGLGLGQPYHGGENPATKSDRTAGLDPDMVPMNYRGNAGAGTALAYAPEGGDGSDLPPQVSNAPGGQGPRGYQPPFVSPPPPGALPNIPDFGSLAKREKGFADSPGFALMNAGLGMMAASGERDAQGFLKHQGFAGLLGAAGKGGQEGLKTVQLQRQQAREDQKLELSAQKHLFEAQKDLLPYTTETMSERRKRESEERKYNQLTAAEKAEYDLKQDANRLAWEKFQRPYSELTASEKADVDLKRDNNKLAWEKFKKPYESLTAEEQAKLDLAREKMWQEDWDVLGPLKGDPSKTVTHNKKTNEYRVIDVGVGPKVGGVRMTETTNDRLVKTGTNVTNITHLNDNFQDDYSGKPIQGTVENWAARNLNASDPRIVRQANWWQAYSAYKAQVRHELYGAALTAYEIAQWDQQDIKPGMSPALVRENLARQKRIVDGAMRRKALSLVATGQDQEAVEAALGFKIADMPDPVDSKGNWREAFPDRAPKETKEKRQEQKPAQNAGQKSPPTDAERAEALDWIGRNPDDPRVPAIKKWLGVP